MKKMAVFIILIVAFITLNYGVFSKSISKMIEVSLNSINIQVNGDKYEAENILYNGKTYVQLRTIAEMFNKNVTWDSYSKTAGINDKKDLTPISIPRNNESLSLLKVSFPYFNLGNLHNKNNIDYSTVVIKDMDYIIIGEPVSLEQNHPEQKIVADLLKDQIKIFGYVEAGRFSSNSIRQMDVIKQEIDNIAEIGWYGVFFDQFGYDYEETRQRQNEMIDYAHSKGLICFVNAWFIEDVFEDIISDENNPSGDSIHLKEGDWYLLESFYSSNSGLRDNLDKYIKASQITVEKNIKISTLTYKRDEIDWDNINEDIEKSYLLSLVLGFDGWNFTDTLSSTDMRYGEMPDFNIGKKLIEPLKIYKNDLYRAKTDKYTIEFNMKNYPNFTYIVYE